MHGKKQRKTIKQLICFEQNRLAMNNLQKNPLKLYIQDIFRATRTPENKYVYEIFGLRFKNIMIQGNVTSIYNTTNTTTNLELSDATGSVLIYYDSSKNNKNVTTETLKDLHVDFAKASRCANGNIYVMTKMMDAINNKTHNKIDFEEGSYLSIVGDIFIDELRDIRMVSAYECKLTSIACDVIWLEELRYLYEKFYLWDKE